jgi:hypothetical protein
MRNKQPMWGALVNLELRSRLLYLRFSPGPIDGSRIRALFLFCAFPVDTEPSSPKSVSVPDHGTSSAMRSGISSGKKRFASSSRRTPRDLGKVR